MTALLWTSSAFSNYPHVPFGVAAYARECLEQDLGPLWEEL